MSCVFFAERFRAQPRYYSSICRRRPCRRSCRGRRSSAGGSNRCSRVNVRSLVWLFVEHEGFLDKRVFHQKRLVSCLYQKCCRHICNYYAAFFTPAAWACWWFLCWKRYSRLEERRGRQLPSWTRSSWPWGCWRTWNAWLRRRWDPWSACRFLCFARGRLLVDSACTWKCEI